MAMTSRENVLAALKFNVPEWIPRETWALPWAKTHLPEFLARIDQEHPSDFGGPENVYSPSRRVQGDPFAVGSYVDEWGCTFENVHPGVIGEVKHPLITDLSTWREVVLPPAEILPADAGAARDRVNQNCAASTAFMRAGCCPRPWERFQFLRGTEEAMMDVMDPDSGAREILRTIHEFHLRELEFWITTDVDAVTFMDDWGSQNSLLIPPPVWRELFKPMYRDYCDLAHSRGKAAFMHSDGCIIEIYPDLVEVGVDALNSQLFTMDFSEMARIAKGKMTFWGEIDRQHVLPSLDPQVGRDAVRKVTRHLYDPKGGIIAQFELSPGSHGPTALAIHEEWKKVHAEATAARGAK